MKFLCNTEFIHGVQYRPGEVYPGFTKEYAEKLIGLGKNKPYGALSYFTPADEEAEKFMKALKSNPAAAVPESKAGNGGRKEAAAKA
jgi:hypothetical protein